MDAFLWIVWSPYLAYLPKHPMFSSFSVIQVTTFFCLNNSDQLFFNNAESTKTEKQWYITATLMNPPLITFTVNKIGPKFSTFGATHHSVWGEVGGSLWDAFTCPLRSPQTREVFTGMKSRNCPIIFYPVCYSIKHKTGKVNKLMLVCLKNNEWRHK